MRQIISVMAALALAVPSAAQVVATATDGLASTADFITVPANTEIWLTPSTEVSSKQLRTGDTFPLIVSRDVFVNRILVIPRGATATAKVSYRTGKGAFGKSAKMEFDLVSVEVAHQPVAVSGHYRVNGSGNSAATVFVVLFVSAVGGAFVTGHSATLPAGSEWRATTVAPLQIAFDVVAPPAGGLVLAARRVETFPPATVPAVLPAVVSAIMPAVAAAPPAFSAAAVPAKVVAAAVVPGAVVPVAAVNDPPPVRIIAAVPVRYVPPPSARDYPPNSAYTPPPAEIFVRTLPPRP